MRGRWFLTALTLGLCACSSVQNRDDVKGVYAVCGETNFALALYDNQAIVEFLGREPMALSRVTTDSNSESASVYSNGQHMVSVAPSGRVSYARGRMAARSCDLTEDSSVHRAVVHTASVADPSSKPVDDWSRFIFSFLPAIDTCLADYVGELPRVSIAWPMNHGYVGMHLVNQNGARTECLSDSVAAEYDMISVGTPLRPGEGQPYFTPVTSAPPFHPDFRHEKVERDGKLLGWLSYRDAS